MCPEDFLRIDPVGAPVRTVHRTAEGNPQGRRHRLWPCHIQGNARVRISWWLVNTVVIDAAVYLLSPSRLGIDEHRYRSVR